MSSKEGEDKTPEEPQPVEGQESEEKEKIDDDIDSLVTDKLTAFDKIDIPKMVDKLVTENATKINRLPPPYIGRQAETLMSLADQLQMNTGLGFDFNVISLFNEEHSHWLGTALPPALSKDDPTQGGNPFLKVSTWSYQVVGMTSPREFQAKPPPGFPTLKEQIAWATHLSLPAVLAPTPPSSLINSTLYAQLLNQVLLGLSFTQLWVEIPMNDEPISIPIDSLAPPPPPITDLPPQPPPTGDEAPSVSVPAPKLSMWERWARLRDLCDYNGQLFLALTLTADLPPESELMVWESEPVRAVIVPEDVFQTNTYGYPCLSKGHQKFLNKMFRLKAQFILRGSNGKNGGQENQDPYLQYLRYLHRKATATDQDVFEEPYYDYLQSPLQPLADNLESQTYETFEKDPIKYKLYESAVHWALKDRADKGTVTLMVLGAGRGPLVVASLRAAETAGVKVIMYAVEKNPNAVITLNHMSRTMGWEGKVTIVSSDMRKWEAPVKADIIVSELLGSFSDNELSPECLDGAQQFLAEDGISIPANYTSFVSPISSQKVWKDVRNWKEQKHYETSYVCKLHNFCEFAPAQPLFKFEHPNRDEVIDNSRYEMKTFRAGGTGYIHGLAGYFESQLYKDVYMSINPASFSEGMISWFPLYFPLHNPIRAKEGDMVDVHFWRCVTSTKVWYEWCVGVNQTEVTPIHNPNGRSHHIGLST